MPILVIRILAAVGAGTVAVHAWGLARRAKNLATDYARSRIRAAEAAAEAEAREAGEQTLA